MTSRAEIVQGLLSRTEKKRYLEIGLWQGETFRSVVASQKHGVDPVIRFDIDPRENPKSRLYKLTSDDFFASEINNNRYDVIFIDGLHTFEQTLRDLLNSLTTLEEGGFIVIDDVIPNSLYAAIPDLAEWSMLRKELNLKEQSWMGDVYKLVFFIRDYLQQWTYATVSDCHGILVMWKAPRAVQNTKSLEEISRLPFSATIVEKATYNLTDWLSIENLLDQQRGK